MSSNSGLHDDDSDHESHHESLYDALSPTDGYFNERHSQPQDVLVPDPSQANSQSNKEREAQEDVEAHRAQISYPGAPGSSRQQYLRQSSVQSPFVSPTTRLTTASTSPIQSETTPLIASAPPAYSPPSPGSPYHNQARSASHTSAGIYSTMGRPEALFSHREPEDLGGEEPLLGGDGRHNRWRQASEWVREANEWVQDNQNKILKSILLLLAIAAGVGFIVNTVNRIKQGREDPMKSNPVIPDPVHGHIPKCWNDPRTAFTAGFDNPGSFSFLQLISEGPDEKWGEWGEGYAKVQSAGELHVIQAPLDAEYDIQVTAMVSVSTRALLDELIFERDTESVGFYLPSWIPLYNTIRYPQPCLYINATLAIKPTANVSPLHIASQSLSVTIDPDLSINASLLDISCVSSFVHFSPSVTDHSGNQSSLTGPRDIKIVTDSGAITGTFPLYDSLHLESLSGSITASVTPKPVDVRRPRPALLKIDSGSGVTHITTPVLASLPQLAPEIPSRDYQSTIKSRSGATTVSLLYGSRMDISSMSGRIFAELTPYWKPEHPSHASFKSYSGSIETIFHGSASHPDAALKHFYSSFYHDTGSLRIRHPATWEGKVRGKFLTGAISTDWHGLQIERYDRVWRSNEGEGQKDDFDAIIETNGDDTGTRNYGYKRFEAYKGSGQGVLAFEGASGSVLLEGEEGE